MHICFTHIDINGFMSIKEGSFDINNQGYVLINGINKNSNDNAKSNGAGKSSCIESIVWALTGNTIRDSKDIVNKYTTDGCKVTLDFTIDSDKYKIIRTKEDKLLGTNLKIYINGEDKSGKGIRDSEKLLEQYLPDLTSSLIGSVIVLGQGLPQRFTNNTPSGRKEVLEKLSKSDYMIEDIKDKLSKRKSTLSEELRKYEDLILSNTSKQEVLNNQLIRLQNDKALLSCDVDYDSDIKTYEEKLHYLEGQQIDTYNYSQQLNNQLNNKLDEYQKWTVSVQNNILSESAHIEENEGLIDIDKVIKQNEFYISNKEQEILKLESVKDICPTCGQHLPDIHKVDTTKLREELELIKADNSKIVEQRKQIKEVVDNKIQLLKDDLNSTTEKIKKESQELRQLYSDVSKQNDNYVKEINNIKLNLDRIKLNKENYEKQKQTIDSDILNTQNQLRQISEFILYNNNERDNINQRLDIVNRMITIATRDFRGFLLSEVISFLDRQAEEYSQQIFNNNKVSFKLEGNNINIYYSDRLYESLSGGEKQKVDLIVQFSIRSMLSQLLNFSSNMLVLDEIFDNLDNDGCQSILDLILNKLKDIDTLFIITHHTDISIPYDKILNIVKDTSGVSYIN